MAQTFLTSFFINESRTYAKKYILCKFTVFPKSSGGFVLWPRLIQMSHIQWQVLRKLPKIVAAGRCKEKKNPMNEQKRSGLYSMGMSLNEKSGKQALGGGHGTQMLTDKNSLILKGRHQCMRWGSNECGIGWTVCSLQVAGRQWAEMSWSKDETHLTSETDRNTHSFHSDVGTQDGQEPQVPTRQEICHRVPERLPRPRPLRVTKEGTRGTFTHPSKHTPSPLSLRPSTAGLSEKTRFADVLTEVNGIWPSEGFLTMSRV